MKSMTGYGSSRVENTDFTVEVSLRAVNGRFLEVRVHLPREYVSSEGEIKKILGQYIQRGTIDIFVTRRLRPTASTKKVTLRLDIAKQYQKAFQDLSRSLKIPLNLHVETLARQPDVLEVVEHQEVSRDEITILKKAFKQACEKCDRERQREGTVLSKEMARTLEMLMKQVNTIENLRENANSLLQEKLETKIRQKLKGGEVDPQRLAQEVVFQLEKSDINEELIRLKTHIENYRSLLKSKQAEGKKLDFYTQELLREINTIGSKSPVSEITQAVVEAKTLIERLREQVQNVE